MSTQQKDYNLCIDGISKQRPAGQVSAPKGLDLSRHKYFCVKIKGNLCTEHSKPILDGEILVMREIQNWKYNESANDLIQHVNKIVAVSLMGKLCVFQLNKIDFKNKCLTLSQTRPRKIEEISFGNILKVHLVEAVQRNVEITKTESIYGKPG